MKYLRRLAAFAAKKLIIFTLIACLAFYAFYLAFNYSNAYIIVSEGLQKRVDVCLTREDPTVLNRYFTPEFLDSDPVLAAAFSEASSYWFYNISSFDYDLKLQNLRWSPFRGTVSCVVTEYVSDINGSVKSEYASTDHPSIEPWKSGRYTVTLIRDSKGWKIAGLKQDQLYKDTES